MAKFDLETSLTNMGFIQLATAMVALMASGTLIRILIVVHLPNDVSLKQWQNNLHITVI